MNGLRDISVDESAQYYTWELPEASIQVAISAEAADRTVAGVETGGVLLGTVGDGSVSIEDAVAVPRSKLREVVLGWDRSPGRPKYVVGFYRTETRGGLSLTPEDRALFAELFPDPLSVVLVIRPRATGSSVAGLFFREHGNLRTEPSCVEFPTRPGQSVPDVPLPSFLSGPPSPDPAPHVPSRGLPLWVSWWIQVPLLAGLLFVDGLLGFIAARQVRPAPERARVVLKDPYALSLLVLEYGDNLHLTWDRNAPALLSAEKALLSINDGGQSRSVNLSGEQLKNASVIYRRLSGQVTLRLEVVLKDKRSVSESWDLTSKTGPSRPRLGNSGETEPHP